MCAVGQKISEFTRNLFQSYSRSIGAIERHQSIAPCHVEPCTGVYMPQTNTWHNMVTRFGVGRREYTSRCRIYSDTKDSDIAAVASNEDSRFSEQVNIFILPLLFFVLLCLSFDVQSLAMNLLISLDYLID